MTNFVTTPPPPSAKRSNKSTVSNLKIRKYVTKCKAAYQCGRHKYMVAMRIFLDCVC